MKTRISLLLLLVSCAANAEPFATCVEKAVTENGLAPLQKKIALVDGRKQSFDMLANTTYPDEYEKPMIAAWAKARERCFAQDEETKDPQVAPSFIEIAARTSRSMLSLISQLYTGKLTYGEFAQKRTALGAEQDAAVNAEIDRLQQQMQRQSSAQQPAPAPAATNPAATALLLQGMGKVLRAGAPSTTRCVSVPIGASVSTTCN